MNKKLNIFLTIAAAVFATMFLTVEPKAATSVTLMGESLSANVPVSGITWDGGDDITIDSVQISYDEDDFLLRIEGDANILVNGQSSFSCHKWMLADGNVSISGGELNVNYQKDENKGNAITAYGQINFTDVEGSILDSGLNAYSYPAVYSVNPEGTDGACGVKIKGCGAYYGDMSGVTQEITGPDGTYKTIGSQTEDGTIYEMDNIIFSLKVSEFKKGSLKYSVDEAKDGEVSVAGSSKKAVKSIKIPATVTYQGKTYKVTGISDKAFKGMKKLKKVTIGKNIKTIGEKAFYSCKKLSKLSTANVKVIKKSAFEKCTSLIQVTFDKKISKIKERAFCGCSNLFRIDIKGTGISKIGSKAFSGTYLAAEFHFSSSASYSKCVKIKTKIKKAGSGVIATFYRGSTKF